jgi:hypothetical protein
VPDEGLWVAVVVLDEGMKSQDRQHCRWAVEANGRRRVSCNGAAECYLLEPDRADHKPDVAGAGWGEL